MLEPSSSLYTPEVLSIDLYEGEQCLIDSDGVLYFNNYDVAFNYYYEKKEQDEANAQERLNVAAYNLKNYLVGTWIDPDWGEESRLVFYDDGTYEDYTNNVVEKSGTWVVEGNDRWLKIILTSSDGETDDCSLNIEYFETNEGLQDFEENSYISFGALQNFSKAK